MHVQSQFGARKMRGLGLLGAGFVRLWDLARRQGTAHGSLTRNFGRLS